MIHGYLGTPAEMKLPALKLQEAGYTVIAPKLAGHATDVRDLRLTNWRDWLRSAIDAYLELASTNKSVCVVGLSMGALIAVIIAARYNPARLALCAPAFFINRPWLPFARIFGLLIERIPDHSYRPDSKDPDMMEVQRRYHAYTWVRPAGYLYKLKRLGNYALSKTTTPTLVIAAKKDSVVPVSVVDHVMRRGAMERCQSLILENGGHVVTVDEDREIVADAITNWFGDVASPKPAGKFS